MQSHKEKWLIVIALTALVAIFSAMVITSYLRSNRNSRVTSCVSNLSQLWKMQWNYAVHFGGPDKRMPTETGGAFWLVLRRTDPPLIDDMLLTIFSCPVKGRRPLRDATDFRGPHIDVNSTKIGDGDPVGADKIGNHGSGKGGNVIRKSGDVITVPEDDPFWLLAAEKTIP